MNPIKIMDIITSLGAFLVMSLVTVLIMNVIVALFASSKYKTYSDRFYARLPVVSCVGIIYSFISSFSAQLWKNFLPIEMFLLIICVVAYILIMWQFTCRIAEKKLNHINIRYKTRREADEKFSSIKAKHNTSIAPKQASVSQKHQEVESMFDLLDELDDNASVEDWVELGKERGLLDERGYLINKKSQENQPGHAKSHKTELRKKTSRAINFKSLADKTFEISKDFMYEYGSMLQSDTSISPNSISYLMDTTSAGTSLYVYTMVKIREKLKERFKKHDEFEQKDTEMIEIFSKKLMESPVSLMKKMTFTENDISGFTQIMHNLNADSYLGKIHNIVNEIF